MTFRDEPLLASSCQSSNDTALLVGGKLLLLCPQGEDDGSTVLPVSDYLDARDGERPVGVYALLDARHNTQYVGYSRNMVLAIKVRGSRCCSFVA
jgi:hypothetical protein